MNFYIAARFDRKEEMRKLREYLGRLGHSVTSRWLDEREGALLTPAMLAMYAQRDLDDIDAAETVLYFTEPPPSPPRGGRHVEAGYALGRGKNVYVVGPLENIFCELPFVSHFQSKEEFTRCQELLSSQAAQKRPSTSLATTLSPAS